MLHPQQAQVPSLLKSPASQSTYAKVNSALKKLGPFEVEENKTPTGPVTPNRLVRVHAVSFHSPCDASCANRASCCSCTFMRSTHFWSRSSSSLAWSPTISISAFVFTS